MRFFKKKKTADDDALKGRITNETVAEHRERILAGGRRYKYPMQYARHRLVINAISIATLASVIAVSYMGWQLYKAQTTAGLMYRITRIVPLPAASVDGHLVRYSDYLMRVRSSLYYLQRSEQVDMESKDGQRQLAHVKRSSMEAAIADGYAQKLAKERKVKIENSQIEKVINEGRTTSTGKISQEAFDTAIEDVLGLDTTEYRLTTRNKLLRQEVSFVIDDGARRRAEQAKQLMGETGKDFDKVAAALGGEGNAKVTVGVSGLVPLSNSDGGLAEAAGRLAVGDVSSMLMPSTGDGYYYVKLLEKRDDELSYTFLRVPLTEFDARIAKLRADGKIKEYISIPKGGPSGR